MSTTGDDPRRLPTGGAGGPGRSRPGRSGAGGWRGPLGMVLLVAVVIGVPIAEVWLLITVGQTIGVLPTIGILLAEAVIGGWLMRREGSRAWRALTQSFGSGRMPSGELADAAFVLVGGVLLMLPGFFTDVFGFFFLLPFTRPLARTILAFVLARTVKNRYGIDPATVRARMDREHTIPGETVPDADGPAPGRPGPDDGRTIRGEVTD